MNALVLSLVKNNISENQSNTLRCKNCGYSFSETDLGDARLELVSSIPINFSSGLVSKRKTDYLKPYENIKNESWTGLEIDHILPVSRGGLTELSNLRICCKFCNRGKQAYMNYQEVLSLFVIGGLSNFINESKLKYR